MSECTREASQSNNKLSRKLFSVNLFKSGCSDRSLWRSVLKVQGENYHITRTINSSALDSWKLRLGGVQNEDLSNSVSFERCPACQIVTS